MSNDPSSTSRSNLDSIFKAALKTYKKKTGKDITSHPLATELQSCNSPDAILAVLRRQVPIPDRSQNGDEAFANSNRQRPLHPFRYTWRGCWSSDYHDVILQSMCALTSFSQVFSPIFAGIGVLLLVGCLFIFVVEPILTCGVFRRSKTSTRARVISSIYSARSSTSSVGSMSTSGCHLPLL